MAKTKEKKPGLLEGVGDFFGGAVDFITHPLQRGVAKTEQTKLRTEELKAKIESSNIQNKFNQLMLQQGAFNDKRIADLSLAAKRLSDVEADDASAAVVQRIRALQGRTNVKTEDETAVDRDVLSKHFAVGVAQLKEEGGPGTLASDEQVEKLTKSFISEANKQGTDSRNAELLFNEFYDAEVEERGILRDDVLPRRKPLDNRDLFSEGINAFDDGAKVSKAPAKDLSEFIQAGTETVPEDTIPKQLSALGITTPGDQQTFQELEAQLPKLDLREAYQLSPADFQKIIKALQSGKAPNGKPFTMKDAIKLITGTSQ